MFHVKLVIETTKERYELSLPKHVDKDSIWQNIRKDMQTNLSFLELIDGNGRTIFINKSQIVSLYLEEKESDKKKLIFY